jgi:g-D-glutamyl-meso-diaminopimelate peptidase
MRRYADLLAELNEWEALFPWSVEQPIGTSVHGERLRLYSVGCGNIHIHLSAAMHANEWLTAFVLARLGTRLCHIWQRRREEEHRVWGPLLHKYKLWFVPLVNPDGVARVMQDETGDEEAWKANARGVDLNDQFPAGWESERVRRQVFCPGPRDYGGESPLSEPEAQALVDLCERVPFAAVFALHSQGQEIYYNYRGLEPPEAKQIAQSMAHVSGYKAIALEDSDAGYKDWFIQQYRRPGFTIELGFGRNPLPVMQWREMTAKLEAILLACLRYESRLYE